MQQEFGDAALVVLGHGSTKNADSEKPVLQHAAELGGRNIFAEVRPAFWKQEPQVTEVLAGLGQDRIFIAPFFVSEGYFSDEVIPTELGFRQEGQTLLTRMISRGKQRLYYCRAIGTHDSMTQVLLSRARQVVLQFPFPRAPYPKDTTLFIAGHGTGQNDNSRRIIERQAQLLQQLQVFADVYSVFMEEEPRIPRCYELSQTRNIVVVPFFISDGLHAQEDIPVLLGESERFVRERLAVGRPTWRNPTERRGKLVWYTPSIGNEPHLANVILESVREVASAQE
jgi:sirohydrochlorin cobaltochelatase